MILTSSHVPFSSFNNYFNENSVKQSWITFNCKIGMLPQNQRHILYIDRSRWEQTHPMPKVDPFLFDNEPGYHDAMEKVLDCIGGNLGEKLDALKLCDLHDMCVDGVFRDLNQTDPFLKGYKPSWNYSFNIDEVPESTLDELHDEGILIVTNPHAILCQRLLLTMMQKNLNFLCRHESFYDSSKGSIEGAIFSNFEDPSDEHLVHKKINYLFDNYYASISTARSDNEKLAAIAKICRAINMFHVFPDGNGRTVLWAMLLKLLLENGFSPAILDTPHKFAAGYYSIQEMVEQLNSGMDNFLIAVCQYSQMDMS